MRRITLVTALALALMGALPAVADQRTYYDAVGDSSNPDFDMIKLTHGHDGGVLVHKITFRGQVLDDGAPEFYIRVGKGKKPDFLLTGGGVFRAGTLRKVGEAAIKAVDRDTVRYRFRAKAINRPDSYEWRAHFGSGSTLDKAPSHYVTHVLR